MGAKADARKLDQATQAHLRTVVQAIRDGMTQTDAAHNHKTARTQNMEETRVIFDISVLGEIKANTSSRTGIFRVVDRLVAQLVERPDCQLYFSCNKALLDIDALLEKVTSECPELSEVTPARLWGPEAVVAQCSSIRNSIRHLKSLRPRTFANKLQLELLRARASLLKRRITFDTTSLAEAHVLHSPWDPLPPSHLFSTSSCRRAITVYDMTPVLFPQFFRGNEGVLESFREIIASITPEDYVLAISECTKSDFCQITGHDPARVWVTPLAADQGMFTRIDDTEVLTGIRRKYALPDGPYILSVNTLQPRKNIAHCIRSFAKLVQERKDCDLSLVLVGDRGWHTKDIDETLRSTGLSANRIVVTGYVPDSDLAALYSGALAFIYVSLYEGFGLPPLEAMQCRVPVITSNNSSLPEVVGDAGILINPTDEDALCAALQSLYENPSLRESYAARAMLRAKHFSWSKCGDDTVKAYRAMLSS